MIKILLLALTLANVNWASVIFRGDPTGATDSAAGLQSAITALAKLGGGTLVIPRGTYSMSTYRPSTHPCKFTNILVPSNVTLEGEQDAQLVQTASGRASVPSCKVVENSVVAVSNPSSFQTVVFQRGAFYDAHSVAANDATVTATKAGEAANFKAGDYIGVYEQKTGDVIPSEFTVVTSVNAATGVIGLAVHLARTFPTAYITKVTDRAVRNVHLKNLTIQGAVPFEAQEGFEVTLENCDLRYDTTVGGVNLVTGFVINTIRDFRMSGGSLGPATGSSPVGTELPQRNSADVTFEGVTFTGATVGTGEFGIHWRVSGCRFWLTSAGGTDGFALQGWDMLAAGNDIHATGYTSPGGACVTDFAGGGTERLDLFGGVRFLGNSIYCDNRGSGNPAVISNLHGTQWSYNHIENRPGTVGAHLYGDNFVFSDNYVNVSYVDWAILAESRLSGSDSGVIANNLVVGGGTAAHGVDFPKTKKAGGYTISSNTFTGFTSQGVNTAVLQTSHPGTIATHNFGSPDFTVDSGGGAARNNKDKQ